MMVQDGKGPRSGSFRAVSSPSSSSPSSSSTSSSHGRTGLPRERERQARVRGGERADLHERDLSVGRPGMRPQHLHGAQPDVIRAV